MPVPASLLYYHTKKYTARRTISPFRAQKSHSTRACKIKCVLHSTMQCAGDGVHYILILFQPNICWTITRNRVPIANTLHCPPSACSAGLPHRNFVRAMFCQTNRFFVPLRFPELIFLTLIIHRMRGARFAVAECAGRNAHSLFNWRRTALCVPLNVYVRVHVCMCVSICWEIQA